MSTLVRKIKLIPVGDKTEVDRVYKFIRDGQYAQYQACNLLMGQLASEFYKNGRDLKSEGFKAAQKAVLDYHNPNLDEIEFPTGLASKSTIIRKIDKDFKTAIKNGLARGERSITNYKRTNPLLTEHRFLKITHEYDSYNNFLEMLYSSNLMVYIKWVNQIKFMIVFGNPHKSAALREEIKNIIEEHYKIQQSSISVEGKDIILNLSINIPDQKLELDENIVVGVDLGIKIPAMCALNNNEYVRLSIGSADDFLRVRTKIKAQRKRLQLSLKTAKSGHGRTRMLKPLDRFKDYESNWVQTYNHMVSKKVVEFAVKNNAKYINLENLEGYDASQFLLSNWSYYQLQQYITYKALKYGIEVRKINPYHTSQICSCCGHWEKGQRIDQAHFICLACGKELNADFNAARNIAKSTDFVAEPLKKKA